MSNNFCCLESIIHHDSQIQKEVVQGIKEGPYSGDMLKNTYENFIRHLLRLAILYGQLRNSTMTTNKSVLVG